MASSALPAGRYDLRVSVALVNRTTDHRTLRCGETHIHKGDPARISVLFEPPPQGNAL